MEKAGLVDQNAMAGAGGLLTRGPSTWKKRVLLTKSVEVRPMIPKIVLPYLTALALAMPAFAEEPVGERPYEMVWAGRNEDTRPPLLDFEDLQGWTVECVDAEAAFVRSRRQQLWGKHVGTLTYRGTGPRATVTLKLPKPVPL